MKRVLFIATSKNTKGGITSVISSYRQCKIWEKYKIRWLETHIDRNSYIKLLYVICSLILYCVIVWFYDIVHIHVGDIKSMRRKSVFFQIASWINKKTIIHLHIGDQIYKMADSKTCKNVIQQADAIIVLSNDMRQKVRDIFSISKDKIFVIPNPCVTVQNVNYSIASKTILFAGRLDYNKAYQILIKAFALIASKHHDWKIVFAGNGEIAKAIRLATENRISGQVEFKGWITGEEKDRIFRESAFLCLPSYAEGFSMTVLEAWAYCLPVVCTPVGGLKEIVKDGDNALVFEPGNVAELALKLDLMITNPDIRQNIAEKSHELSQSLFNLQRICERIDNLYTNISLHDSFFIE
ncbi:MAG: glycosyltransferase family 4 protein [Tannerella sp.]|jgi:glycosyltransferase involved in cell wall biosynthesis|nr:glycosyltransferase family 4 protein [Tannerella sp.]